MLLIESSFWLASSRDANQNIRFDNWTDQSSAISAIRQNKKLRNETGQRAKCGVCYKNRLHNNIAITPVPFCFSILSPHVFCLFVSFPLSPDDDLAMPKIYDARGECTSAKRERVRERTKRSKSTRQRTKTDWIGNTTRTGHKKEHTEDSTATTPEKCRENEDEGKKKEEGRKWMCTIDGWDRGET